MACDVVNAGKPLYSFVERIPGACGLKKKTFLGLLLLN